jgi:2-dehydro-3-deoxy-D-arabinonate dehydratase
VLDGDHVDVLAETDPLAVLSAATLPAPVDTVAQGDAHLLTPLIPPETWAAGVTYERSRQARLQESQVADVYDLVYEAERPELFLKDAAGRRTVGPGEPIATRADAAWTVPEPELAVVVGADRSPLAVTIGNDVSSRDIEGANPLYLPQAKIYAGACALGPALFVPRDWSAPFEIHLRIAAPDGETIFEGRTSTANMCRSLTELIDYLFRDNPVPAGTVLLTGTGIVPPDDVTLDAGQSVEITIPEIGTLRNPVGAVEVTHV